MILFLYLLYYYLHINKIKKKYKIQPFYFLLIHIYTK